jgi:AcrR family transcriptional regulator
MQPANKQQLRTQETQSLLLDAAEEIFIRDGFEGAQLDEIAALAGRSKGAVYAHFKNKEDLFLALFEHRVTSYIARLNDALLRCTSRHQALQSFRDFYTGLVTDQKWSILTLEFKLYALRHPESQEHLRKAFELSKATANNSLHERMFGHLTPEQKIDNDLALIALGPFISGLILESHFEPEHLTESAMRRVLGRVFDAFFPAGR